MTDRGGEPTSDAGGPPEGESSLPRTPEVTVCIPAYNERPNIGPLLAMVRGEVALGARITGVLVEVSGSTDGTASMVQDSAREWPSVRVLDSPTRQGLARAVARLIEAAPTEVVARVDADVRFPPGTIVGLVMLRNGILGELSDTASAIGNLDQSYSYNGRTLNWGTYVMSVNGSSYTDPMSFDGSINAAIPPATPNAVPGEN